MHEFRCYDNIAPNAKCQRVLELALCLVEVMGFSLVNPCSYAVVLKVGLEIVQSV